MTRKIPILTEETSERIVRGAAPLPLGAAIKSTEISTSVLKAQLSDRLRDLNEIFSELPTDVGGFTPSEISISLAVSGNGEISLLSAIKGSLGVTSTFVVKLTRRA
jgi:hypothetical protein